MSIIEERIKDIHKNYIEVICPYILQYELLKNEFPIEILNEIRAVFTHLSKCYLSEDVSIKEKNLLKAEDHIKRAILDCYKYICMIYNDKYVEFEKNYKRIDLSLVDNGEFLPKLLEGRKRAVELMLEARESDLAITSDNEIGIDEAYKKYEKAFIAYSSVYELINNSYIKLEHLKKKAIFKDFITIISFILGIVGITLSIVFYFFQCH